MSAGRNSASYLPGLALVILVAAALRAQEYVEPPLTNADSQHWAYRPLAKVAVPPLKCVEWAGEVEPARNAVDYFIRAKLAARGLAPAPPADRATLLRRVTFDLTGLPPTPEEYAAFMTDAAPDAYERLVNRLLASPAYGERWAQHWLDLARFAETDGFEHDLVRPNAWRYRDWVIQALDDDLPYDEFIRRQVAGDLLAPEDHSAAIPTGFLLCGPDMPDINDQEERRSTVLSEMTATVGSVLLGAQLGCAQCHDHKFDPLSQGDFYRLRAFFESLDIFREHPVATPAELASRREAEAAASPEVKQLQAEVQALTEQAAQRLREKNPDLLPTRENLKTVLSRDEQQQLDKLTAEVAKRLNLAPLPSGRVVREGPPREARLLIRGDHRRKGDVVQPAFPRVCAAAVSYGKERAPQSRLDLARWLTCPDNALALRVIVNRLWQHHFGEGLSRSPSDFGRMGQEPTHPDLLDWLAAELVRQDFSLKRMHYLLVTSATYRQASRPPAATGPDGVAVERARPIDGRISAAVKAWQAARQSDPGNTLWWRMKPRRLEGEAIRDALLAAGDDLNRRRGGPGVRPPLPPELVSQLLKNQWDVSPDPADHQRRSIYLFVRRNLRYPLLEVFDRPDTNASCPQRTRSTTAPQALMLLNAELSLHAARRIAGAALYESRGDARQCVVQCCVRTLGRVPREEEIAAALTFVARQAKTSRADPPENLATPLPAHGVPPRETELDAHESAAWVCYCLALCNTSEFVYVD